MIFPFFSFQNFLDGTNEIFQFFSFLCSVMADSFQISKLKFSFQISKKKNTNSSFKIRHSLEKKTPAATLMMALRTRQ
jgi:hypothetical protein